MNLAGRTLADLGERRIFREMILPRYRAVPGFGNDCASLPGRQVVTTDSCGMPLVAQLGFPDPGFHAGWLLATMNLSDLATAGARPEGLVVNYTLPASTTADFLDRIMQGVDECARRHGTGVVGGDVRDGHEMVLSATAIGRRPRGTALSRRGASPGDRLMVIGSPGYLWGAALMITEGVTVSPEYAKPIRWRAGRPIAQIEAGRQIARAGLATAALDLSDGLYAGVRLLAEANSCGAALTGAMELDEPLHVLCDKAKMDPFQLGQTWGDWCLLIAAAPEALDEVHSVVGKGLAQEIGVLTTRTGVITICNKCGEDVPWQGIDQERFSATSWRGGSIDDYLNRLRVGVPDVGA